MLLTILLFMLIKQVDISFTFLNALFYDFSEGGNTKLNLPNILPGANKAFAFKG